MQDLFVGIDPGAVAGRSRRSFTYAALDKNKLIIKLGHGDLSDLLTFLSSLPKAIVAITGPARLNCGLASQQPNLIHNLPGKSTRMRQVETDLRAHGLRIPATPSTIDACPQWMKDCLSLFKNLYENGFSPYPSPDNPHQVFETQAEALFYAWTGSSKLLHLGSLEGRIQRQLALLEKQLPVWDPMSLFEEITRHKLLRGNLPVDKLHSQLELNALACAIVAWQAFNHPESLQPNGSPDEGTIFLVKSLSSQ